MIAVWQEHGVQFWLPEAGGRVDFGSVEHRSLMSMLGAQSEREVIRTRNRVIQAMLAQTRDQGRFLGARPGAG